MMDSLACPLCGDGEFAPYRNRKNAKCLGCGSLERTRLMWMAMEAMGVAARTDLRILHFAPEEQLARKLSALPGARYVAADIDPERYSALNAIAFNLCEDLDRLEPDSYDLIVHSHVLEHLPASPIGVIAGLDRALAQGGVHIFAVPIAQGWTEENLDPELPKSVRTERFGQHNHLRRLGVQDFVPDLKRFWRRDEVAFDPSRHFTPEELARAAIPKRFWTKISGATPFYYVKGDVGAA